MLKGMKKSPLERVLSMLFSLIILTIIFLYGKDAINKPNNIFTMMNNINGVDSINENTESQNENIEETNEERNIEIETNEESV